MRANHSVPGVYIVAGPNGAGKTTFASRYLPRYTGCRNFVNVDMIAKGLSPFDVDSVTVTAAKIFLRRIDDLIAKRVDFAFETTLAGRSYVHLFRKLKLSGYRIHLIFLSIPAVELSLQRIAVRVAEGGHNVPEEIARRRFMRSTCNLIHLYRALCDEIVIINNRGEDPHTVAVFKGDNQIVYDQEVFNRILKQSKERS